MASDDQQYANGLRDGILTSLAGRQDSTDKRLDDHEVRIRLSERVQFGLLGAVFLMQVMPLIKDFIK
jgi:hypothetical protein